jgi:CelD/BcsL family acetyltransferase involved in cellulose biosynthesis
MAPDRTKAKRGNEMAGFWRLMSTQHWPDEVRRLVAPSVRNRLQAIRPFADDETLVESVSPEAMEPHRDAWNDLAQRALEPNPFLEPDFALSAALHLPAGQRPEFVVVWQGVGFEPRARLIGLWAIEKRGQALLPGVERVWKYKHSALGTPLVDRFGAARSIDELLKWLASRQRGRSTLAISTLVRGPVFDLLTERCAASGLSWTVLEESERAVLLPGGTGEEALARARSTKHRRELDRLRRRLDEQGCVTSHSTSSPEGMRAAAEWFMALEQKGWKGQRASAFLSDVGETAFLRTFVRLLARSGKGRIDWIAVDERPIAMAIVLTSGDRAYFWKTTYDEEFAYFSPGVQLVRELAGRQSLDTSYELTDSCAIADHPMIDRMWPDRQRVVDLLLNVDPARARMFPLIARRERLRRDLRAVAKIARNRALGRRSS